jgi:hypothetical protein
VAGALFVPDEDVLDLVLLEQGVVDRQRRPARIPKNVLHALIDQGLDHDLRAGHLLGHLLSPHVRRPCRLLNDAIPPRRPELRAIKKAPEGTLARTGLSRNIIPRCRCAFLLRE